MIDSAIPRTKGRGGGGLGDLSPPGPEPQAVSGALNFNFSR